MEVLWIYNRISRLSILANVNLLIGDSKLELRSTGFDSNGSHSS